MAAFTSAKIIVIDKTGSIKETKVKIQEYREIDLYKKAGFKTNDCFERRHIWKDVKCKGKTYDQIILFGKRECRKRKQI